MPVRTPTIDSISETDGVLASTYRQSRIGEIGIGEVVFLRDWAVETEDVGSSYYVQMPMAGRFASRHLGIELLAGRDAAAVYRPGSGPFTGRWAGGCRALCVRLDRASVDGALARQLGVEASSRITFEHAMNTADGFGRKWAELLISLNRQLARPNGLLSQPLVAAPLAESVLNGFLFAARHSHSDRLAVPAAAARPAAVRTAVDLIEADPLAPLTVASLAAHSGVSTRTLQNGFRAHLGLSPMAYVRDVRLRRAHEELRAADPFSETVAAVARRWGFRHLGRFAAAHEAKYGRTPLKTLRG